MINIGGKKKSLGDAILMGSVGSQGDVKDDYEEDDSESDLKACVSDLAAAFGIPEDKIDIKAAVEALKSFCTCLESREDEDEPAE